MSAQERSAESHEAERLAAREAGYREGLAQGVSDGQARVGEIMERYARAVERINIVGMRLVREQAQLVVDLAMATTKELIRHELSIDPSTLVTNVRALLAEAGTDRPVRVRLGHADLCLVRSRLAELAFEGVELVEDSTLAVGGIIVEGPSRVIDGSTEPTLSWVAERLRHVVEHALGVDAGGANLLGRNGEPSGGEQR